MNPSSDLHVPLDKPPQAISLTVRSLLSRVVSGGIRVPEFQRPLRWRSDDVVKLFDSLVRGYPIGALLFWKRPAKKDDGYRIGGAKLPVPESPDAWWIVDGQQRVTALAAALLELDHSGDRRWVVRYDPAQRKFLAGLPEPAELGRVVPLSVLGDLRRLGRWLRLPTMALDEAEQGVLEEVQQRILDYELSAYLMETDEPEALKGVFARMNSTGVRMRSDEVFQALLGTDRPGRRGLDLVHLQTVCDLDGFGQPSRDEVYKSVLAMSGQDPSLRFEMLNDDALATLVSPEAAEEALTRTVAFLQAAPDAAEPGCGIPFYGFIPYPVVFGLLARWFHVFPDTSRLTRIELARWLWRGVVTGTHERAAVSKMRDQVRLIGGASADLAVSALHRAVGEPLRVDWSLDRFDLRSAHSRVELLALLSLSPRYRDGGEVSWRALTSSGERIAREIFPINPKQRDRLAQDEQNLITSAANRALLDTQHTGLRIELRDWDPVADQAALSSHLIDEELFRHLVHEDMASFLRLRAPKVQTLVSRFLTERAGLGSPRLGPTERYADPDPELDFPASATWPADSESESEDEDVRKP